MHLNNKSTLQEKEYVFFDSETITKFIVFLKDQAELFAPHKKGENSFVYRQVIDAAEVVLDYPRTIQPLKKFFLPPKETLLNFNMRENNYDMEPVEVKKRIFFGIHSYEMQAIHLLDYNFKRGNPESNYLNRREQSLFIGISYKPDEYHFGKSVGLEIEKTDGLSLYIEPVDSGYFVFIIDEQGQKLIDNFGQSAKKMNLPEIAAKEFKKKIKYHYNRLPQVFDQAYKSDVWQKVSEKCLGCGTCNLLCPTCYCFDVCDEWKLNLKNGERVRKWDACMLSPFAVIGSGENFRHSQVDRLHHRIDRKFNFLMKKHGQAVCVGCGRCVRACLADISPKTIAEAITEKE